MQEIFKEKIPVKIEINSYLKDTYNFFKFKIKSLYINVYKHIFLNFTDTGQNFQSSWVKSERTK